MRLTISFCSIVTASLLAAGCVSSRPVHYYTIDLPSSPANPAKPDGLTILVGNIATPEPLQDGRIRYRAGNNEAGAYEYHRWAERPGEMVREALVRTLRSSGKYRRVLESASSAVGDYLLRGKLHEFGEVDRAGIETNIRLHIELVDTKTNRVVWDHLAERTEPVGGKTVPEVVASMDRNLHQVVNEVTAGIDQFLSAQR
ncbi:MAG TPA: ABC-type transport auxiliary lipoprotein family protein [Bryobacteraceae bacterium]|nr:ABC-type transport auxiliary lipoprotein family protein [Bryobacteraceae bacterium]